MVIYIKLLSIVCHHWPVWAEFLFVQWSYQQTETVDDLYFIILKLIYHANMFFKGYPLEAKTALKNWN